METYDIWRMTKRDDRRVGRCSEPIAAITHAKKCILPNAFVRVEHWTDAGRVVVWDSMDGDSAEPGRKQQLRDFIRPKRASPAGGLRT